MSGSSEDVSQGVSSIISARTAHPRQVRESLLRRVPFQGKVSRVLMVAADHAARGAMRAGHCSHAMEDRWELLSRLEEALRVPGVNGFLGTADLIEDLSFLHLLDSKLVFGSVNRGGLAGASWGMDDRVTGYDPAGIERARLDGGKMLLRLDLGDPRTAPTLQSVGRTVDELARRGLRSMIEPFISARDAQGSTRNLTDAHSVATAAAVASGLGSDSSATWLKLPLTDDLPALARSTTCPILVLGGEVPDDPDTTYSRWAQALELPNVIGLVLGRSVLYPQRGSVSDAVSKAAGLVGSAS